MIYLQLMLVFMKIGVLSFGGGYAVLSLIQSDIVDTYGWLTATEFSDVVTISQLTPGPIAINAATFVGTKVAGILGCLVATVSLVLPSLIIVTIIAVLYKKYRKLAFADGLFSGMRPAATGLIVSVSVSIIMEALFMAGTPDSINVAALAIFAVCFVLIRYVKWSPMLVLLGSGVVGAVVYSFFPSLLT